MVVIIVMWMLKEGWGHLTMSILPRDGTKTTTMI
jgi:hypothetical protein